jgi:two-component system, OmpR family, phosphate regulon sensor histidine kinase PhoR
MRIDVFDTGSGIAEQDMPKIFDAFTRPDHTRGDGLGIGLFIVRQAIGMLGHRVDASSIACRGSRFSIFAAASREKGRRSVSVIQEMENSERHHEIRVGE